MGKGERATRNDLAGDVAGTVVQAGTVGQVTIHEAVRELPVPSQLPLRSSVLLVYLVRLRRALGALK